MLLVRWGYQLLNKSGSRMGERLLFVPWPLLYTQIKYSVTFVIFLGLFAPQFLRKGSGGQLLMLLVRWGYRPLTKIGFECETAATFCTVAPFIHTNHIS